MLAVTEPDSLELATPQPVHHLHVGLYGAFVADDRSSPAEVGVMIVHNNGPLHDGFGQHSHS